MCFSCQLALQSVSKTFQSQKEMLNLERIVFYQFWHIPQQIFLNTQFRITTQ
ncbi:hypothetical protein pb186bvf_000409 [Paramecium bursaria]